MSILQCLLLLAAITLSLYHTYIFKNNTPSIRVPNIYFTLPFFSLLATFLAFFLPFFFSFCSCFRFFSSARSLSHSSSRFFTSSSSTSSSSASAHRPLPLYWSIVKKHLALFPLLLLQQYLFFFLSQSSLFSTLRKLGCRYPALGWILQRRRRSRFCD